VRIATVGHSTRSIDDFLDLLRAHSVEQIVDVRRFPASRRHPHFGREPLESALRDAGVGYAWMEALGGRRRRRAGSPHVAWQVAGFAAYADYMDTPEFERAARELLERARDRFTAILCAEARPEQCHRRLIADWLVVRGVEASASPGGRGGAGDVEAQVVHLLDRTRTTLHRLPDFARVEEGRLIYDGGQLSL
jgi:uncharacterized protein (DUF488 family)